MGVPNASTFEPPLLIILIKLYIQIDEYQSVFTTQIERVVRFFEKNPNYGGIKQIKTDLHLIEVYITVSLVRPLPSFH